MIIAYCGPISLKLLTKELNVKDMPTDGYSYPFGAYFVKALLKQKIEVVVVTSVTGIANEITWECGLLKVIATPRRESRIMMLDSYALERKKIVKALRESGADLVHAQWTYEFCHSARKSGLPFLVTARDAPWLVCIYFRKFYRFYRLIYAYWALFGVKNLTAVSPHIALNFKKYHGFNGHIPVIPNAIPDGILANEAKKHPGNNNLVLVSISSWSSLKNVKTTIRAFSLLLQQYPSSRLRLIGSGLDLKSEAHSWASKRGLSKNIDFVGKIPHDEIMSVLINEAHLFVYSSLEESFCMVVLEAMASGVPVVILPNSGALPWLVDNGSCGEIASEQTAESMAKACLKVLESSDYYENLANAGLKRVFKNYTMPRVIKLYIETYTKILV